MIDYTQWDIEDFIDNESFLHYVLKDNTYDVETWSYIIETNPQIIPITEKAAQILDLLSRAKKPEPQDDIQERLRHYRNQMILTGKKELTWIGISIRTIKEGLPYAATILLFIAIGLGIQMFLGNLNNKNQLCKTIVGKGQKSIVILPDSTKVWLNSESELTYPADFGKHKREVSLIGEAYFNVTHDSKHPFLVNAAEIRIKVYGTEFNVKCYKDEQTVETTLIKGSLSVSHKGIDDEANEILLKPDQQYVYYKNDLVGTKLTTKKAETKQKSETNKRVSLQVVPPKLILNINSSPVIAWKEQKLVFNDEPFSDLAIKLERWYDVRVIIKSEKIKQYRYKGAFENETIEQALTALKVATPFNFSIKKRTVYITE